MLLFRFFCKIFDANNRFGALYFAVFGKRVFSLDLPCKPHLFKQSPVYLLILPKTFHVISKVLKSNDGSALFLTKIFPATVKDSLFCFLTITNYVCSPHFNLPEHTTAILLRALTGCSSNRN